MNHREENQAMDEESGREAFPAIGVAMQLALSCLLAAGGAVAVISVGGLRPGAIAAAVVVGGTFGLVSTASLQRNLYLIDLALSGLARMRPVEPLQPWPRWPLSRAVSSVNAVGHVLSEQAQRERETNEYREQLLQQVSVAAAQEERNRLARELHDSIKQQIFSISMGAATAEARWRSDPDGAQAAIVNVRRSAQEALVEMQALLQQLRPGLLEGVGLHEAIQTQCEALSYRTGAEVVLERFDPPLDDLLLTPVQEALFRMVQEALSNVARHARARHVALWLEQQNGALQLRIRDDGQGFEPDRSPTGAGLSGIRERAQSLGGNLEIESVPGQGTLLQVRIPLRRPALGVIEAVEPDREMERLREERRNAIKFGTLVEQITVLLIFLGAPISAVALGLGVAIFNSGRLRLLWTRMEVRPDHGQPGDLHQQHQELGLLAGSLGVAGLSVPYLFVVQRAWHLHLQAWQVVGATLVIEALALAVALRWYRGIDRYLGQLPRAERQRAVEQRVRSLRDGLGIWLVVVIIAVIVGFSLGFPPHTSNQWADDTTLAILIMWPLIAAADYLRAVRWQRRLPAVAV